MKIIALATIIATATPALCANLWDAGLDLKAHEFTLNEALSTNSVAAAWSYGYRPAVAGLDFTPFTIPEHTNALGGYAGLEGWAAGGTAPIIAVNTTASPLIFNNGPGPTAPLNPNEVFMHPGNGSHPSVLRWTAPAADSYTISTYWQDIDPYGGSGAAGYIVVNGVIAANGTWANGIGQGFTDSNRTVALNAGDVVDFVLDSNGDYFNDSTKFGAVIVPEPATSTLLLAGCGGAALLRRRRFRA